MYKKRLSFSCKCISHCRKCLILCNKCYSIYKKRLNHCSNCCNELINLCTTYDKLTDDLNNAEKAVIAMSEKMLLGVGSRYGKNSQEYEMAGGARRGNTKKKQSVLGNSKPINSLVADSVKLSSVNGSMNGVSGAIVS